MTTYKMPATPLRVVVVEDREADANLSIAELRRSGFEPEWVRVETQEQLERALENPPDVVLADYALPQFDAMRALGVLLERAPHVPLIVVTGQLGDEAAAECMKMGACDYVLKDRLARLGPAVEIALQQKRLERERQEALAALETSEQRLKLVLEGSQNAFWDMDLAAGTVERSSQLAEMLGYRPEEISWINAHWEEIVHPEDLPEARKAFEAHLKGERPAYEAEYRLRTRDGRWMWVLDHGRVVRRDPEGRPLRAAGALRDITESKNVRERLTRSLYQLRALARRLQTVREEERTGIAREVHDVLGQEMTGLKLDVQWILDRVSSARSLEDVAPVRDKLTAMKQQLEQVIQTIRRISTDLRPAVLDAFGLVAALEWQAADFERRAGIPCVFRSNEEDVEMDEGRATAVFRIFQEALTNVARHARATRVEAELKVQGDTLELRVSDNGIGVSREKVAASRSLGLLGMQERALMFDGHLEVEGAPGRGTTVRLIMPLKNVGPAEEPTAVALDMV